MPVESDTPLPPDQAFIVQLRPQTAPDTLFVGRLEHIVTGAVRRFGSAEELLALLARLSRTHANPTRDEETRCRSNIR